MKKSIATLAAASLLAPAIANADFSYTSLEAGYVYYSGLDFDAGADQDMDGVRIKGSVALTPDFFVFGDYNILSDDFDFDSMHLGVGFRAPIAPVTDLYAGVSFERMELDFPGMLGGGSVKDNGFGLRGGMRHKLTPDLEFKGELRYVDIGGDIDYDYFGFNLGLQLLITPEFGLIAEYDNFDGDSGFIIGGRFNF